MLNTDALPAGTLAALTKLMQVGVLSDRILVGGMGPEPVKPFIIIPELEAVGQVSILNTTNIGLHLIFDEVKVDIIKYGYSWIRPMVHEAGIRLASVEDIAAIKLSAVTNRGSKKDFYEIYFLLQDHTLPTILGWFEEKFPNWNLLIVLKSLTYFDDAIQTDQPVILGRKVSWETVKKAINQAVGDYNL